MSLLQHTCQPQHLPEHPGPCSPRDVVLPDTCSQRGQAELEAPELLCFNIEMFCHAVTMKNEKLSRKT